MKWPEAWSKAIDRIHGRLFADADEPRGRVPWWARILLACLGGTCVFLAFPTFDCFYLAYFALFFELWAVEGLRPRAAFLVGWLAGCVTNTGGFYWISDLLEDFGHMAPWLAMTICLALCFVQGLVFGLWTWGMRKLGTRSIWTCAVPLFVVIEMLFPMIFPWYYANSQYNFPWAVQTADIFGVLGVSCFLVCVNVLLYDVSRTLILRRHGHRVPFHRVGLGVGVGWIAFACIYAPVRMAQIDHIERDAPKMAIGMVEGDVGIWEKEPPEKLRNNLFIHQTLSRALSLEGVDLIVWPESSYQVGLIWGSRLSTESPLEHELDALYAPWFQPQARLVYDVVDAGFGQDFHRNPTIHKSLVEAMAMAAEDRGLKTLESKYPTMVSGYGFACKDDYPQIMRCPFTRIVPDDLTYYIPSAEPLRASRKDDLLRQIRPEDISAPVRGFDAAVLFGTLSISARDEAAGIPFETLYRLGAEHRRLYNTAHLVEKDGRVLGKYHKNYLLMFGEYIPYADRFPWVYDILPEAGNLTPGEETSTMAFRGYELGPFICYEDILPRYVRKLSALKPHVFINITNDAWFGKTSEPMLHLALATMRSVEHRRWLVRSTNTGVSAFVDPNGRIVQHTSIYEPEILRQDVAMMPQERTIYSVIGDFLGWLALAWIALLAAIRIAFGRKKRHVGGTEVAQAEVAQKVPEN